MATIKTVQPKATINGATNLYYNADRVRAHVLERFAKIDKLPPHQISRRANNIDIVLIEGTFVCAYEEKWYILHFVKYDKL